MATVGHGVVQIIKKVSTSAKSTQILSDRMRSSFSVSRKSSSKYFVADRLFCLVPVSSLAAGRSCAAT